MKLPLWGLVLVLAAGLAAAGCHRTDTTAFNGAWKLDVAASQNVPAMMQGHSNVMSLAETPTILTITFIYDGDPLSISKFQLDRQTHPLNLGGIMGTEKASRSANGRGIQIEIARPANHGQAAQTEDLVFSLGPGGKTIRRTRTVEGQHRPPQVYIYRKMKASPAPATVPSRLR
ncbi:MAG: hypothetical protein ACRD13_09355 [Terriglobales bacterium]